MCELFAMSSSQPAQVNLSLDELAGHSVPNGANQDGWGVVLYQDRDARLVKEAEPARGSAILQFMQEHDLRSTLVISHIRHATRGHNSHANTHPFCRELGGHVHTFAHNGTLKDVSSLRRRARRPFRPVGETDSEEAFCILLERMEDSWLDCDGPPALQTRLDIVAEFAASTRELGEANFLYADGDVLFVHGHQRRAGVDYPAQWPGLCVTMRSDRMDWDGEEVTTGISMQTDDGRPDVLFVASVPLSREPWHGVPEGSVLAVRNGRILARDEAD